MKMEFTDDVVQKIGEAFANAWSGMQSINWNLFLAWLYDICYDTIGKLFTYIGNMGTELFDLPWVQGFLQLFRYIGWALFLAGLLVAVFDTAIEYQSMRRIDIKGQCMPFLYGLLAVNLFADVPVRLYVFCVNLQQIFLRDLSGLFSSDVAGRANIQGAVTAVWESMKETNSTTGLFFLLVLAYCVIKTFFGNIKRSSLLLAQIAVGSLHLFSLPKGNPEGFISWMKQVIGLCLTAFLQMTMLYLGLLTWQESALLGIGMLLAAGEVPRIAQSFGMETGMKTSIQTMMQTTVSAVRATRALLV